MKRSILYTILMLMNMSVLVQADMTLVQHPLVKKMRTFLRTKKGQLTVAAGMALLGATGFWYLRRLRKEVNQGVSAYHQATELPIRTLRISVANKEARQRVPISGSKLCKKARAIWKEKFSIDVTVKLSRSEEEKQFLFIILPIGCIQEGFLPRYDENDIAYFQALAEQVGILENLTIKVGYKQGPRFTALDRVVLS